jgi:hypothetical protein
MAFEVLHEAVLLGLGREVCADFQCQLARRVLEGRLPLLLTTLGG